MTLLFFYINVTKIIVISKLMQMGLHAHVVTIGVPGGPGSRNWKIKKFLIRPNLNFIYFIMKFLQLE